MNINCFKLFSRVIYSNWTRFPPFPIFLSYKRKVYSKKLLNFDFMWTFIDQWTLVDSKINKKSIFLSFTYISNVYGPLLIAENTSRLHWALHTSHKTANIHIIINDSSSSNSIQPMSKVKLFNKHLHMIRTHLQPLIPLLLSLYVLKQQ